MLMPNVAKMILQFLDLQQMSVGEEVICSGIPNVPKSIVESHITLLVEAGFIISYQNFSTPLYYTTGHGASFLQCSNIKELWADILDIHSVKLEGSSPFTLKDMLGVMDRRVLDKLETQNGGLYDERE